MKPQDYTTYLSYLKSLNGNIRQDQLDYIESVEKGKDDINTKLQICLNNDKLIIGTLEDLEVFKLTSLITADYKKALEESITFEYNKFPQCDEKKLAEKVNEIISKYDSSMLAKVNLAEIQQNTLKEVLKTGQEKALEKHLFEEDEKRAKEEAIEE